MRGLIFSHRILKTQKLSPQAAAAPIYELTSTWARSSRCTASLPTTECPFDDQADGDSGPGAGGRVTVLRTGTA